MRTIPLPVEPRLIKQAYKYALRPTPAQARAFMSHAGGARFAYNWAVAKIGNHFDAYQAAKKAGQPVGDLKPPNHFDLSVQWTAYKNTHQAIPDEQGRTTHWVGDNFVGTYQAALRDAATSLKNWFDSVKGTRRGKRMGRPKFKSRHRARTSFQVHGDSLKVIDSRHVHLPKIGAVATHEPTRKLRRRLDKGETVCPTCTGSGTVKCVPKKETGPECTGDEQCKRCKGTLRLVCEHCKVTDRKTKTSHGTGRVPVARIVRGTISRDSRGRWWLSLTVFVVRDVRGGPSQRQRAGGVIGVDLGVRDVITPSKGQWFEAPRYLDTAQRKLARLNRALARTAKDSRRRAKARARLARAHGRVASLRLDATHKMTSHLIHTHEHIVVEGWNAQQTAQHGSKDLPKHLRRRRNRNLADAAVGIARWQLQSKAVWYGCTVTTTTPHEATGRTCSACGQVRTKPVPLDQEQFHCPACGYKADRRLNTARVLAKIGRETSAQPVAPSGGETQNARGGDVRPDTPRRAGRSPAKREARTRQRDKTGTPDP